MNAFKKILNTFYKWNYKRNIKKFDKFNDELLKRCIR